MKIYKRALSLFLALIMVFALLPGAALAEEADEPIEINENEQLEQFFTAHIDVAPTGLSTLFIKALGKGAGKVIAKTALGFLLPPDDTTVALNAISGQLSVIDGNVNDILANSYRMIGMLGDLHAEVNRVSQGVADLNQLVRTEFAELHLNDILRDLDGVNGRLNTVWPYYVYFAEGIADPDHRFHYDGVARRMELERVMGLIRSTYAWGSSHTFHDDLRTVWNLMGGGQQMSMPEAHMEVAKNRYPFEHQIYETVHDAFHYGIGLQTKLLHLYWEYTTYENERIAPYRDSNEMWRAYPPFDYQADEYTFDSFVNGRPGIDGAIDRIDKQIDAADALLDMDLPLRERLMHPDEIESRLLLENGKELATYHVRMNRGGHFAMIARQAVPARDMLYRSGYLYRHDVFDTYARSHDGRWTAPNTLAELNRIFPADKNPARMVRYEGGLTTLTQIDAISMGSSYPGVGIRFAHAGQPAATLDAIIDVGSFADVFFPTRGRIISVSDADFLPVFLDRTQGIEDMPREPYGNGYRYKPTHANQLPESLILNDGDVLDLTGLVDTWHDNKTEINVIGNAKILGGGRTLYQTHIALHDAHLTLEDVTFNAAGPYGAALTTRSPASQVRVVGTVGLIGSDYGIYSFRGNSLSVFGGIAGIPVLNIVGDVFALHMNGFEAQDMTINLTVPSGSGIDRYHTPMPAFANCTVNFTGITSNPRGYFYRCTVNGFVPVSGRVLYLADYGDVISYCDETNIYINGKSSNFIQAFFYARDKSYAGTKDDIRFKLGTLEYITSPATPFFSAWMNMGTIDRGASKRYHFTFTSAYKPHTRESFIVLQKNGNDGVDLESIQIFPGILAYNNRPNVSSNYGPLKWDDSREHILYRLNYVPTYSQSWSFAAEKVPQSRAATLSYSSENLVSPGEQHRSMLETIADMTDDQVVHIPIVAGRNFEPDGSFLRALVQSEGELRFNLFEGEEKWLSWAFCSKLLKGADLDIDTLKVGLEIGRPSAMGFPNLPAAANILRFEKSELLPGLARIYLHDSAAFRLAAGERWGLYRIVDGGMELAANDLTVDSLYRLSFTPDDFSHDFALVRRETAQRPPSVPTGSWNPPPSHTDTPTSAQSGTNQVTVNGQPGTINADGVINISEQDPITLFVPTAMFGDRDLTIVTNFGTLIVPNAVLKKLGETLRLVITRGSFTVAIVTQSGAEVPYHDPENPLRLILPYALTGARNTETVVAVRGDGIVMPFSIYRDGLVAFDIPATGTYDVIYNLRAFPDVAGHWAIDHINFVGARELYVGNTRGEFMPQGSMTRAMFAQVLANLEQVDLSAYNTSRFTDVAASAWYAPAVEWAAAQGIVSGYGNGRFGPGDEITREQMAVMLYNYAKYKGLAPVGAWAIRLDFEDLEDVSDWAFESIMYAVMKGIITGKPGNLYDPKTAATRAEVAAIFARFIDVTAP